ncbi:hypothetical protein GGI07_000429 [Coemansia sp. Benny D115]|nr:hypothetical protein GGI07_000429 [Coemansia sp. Benny D115]
MARVLRPRGFSSQTPPPRGEDPDKLLRLLPPKPEAPSNDDCCLSGCEFCVWDLYDEDMREYQKQAETVRKAFEAQGRAVPKQVRPENLHDSVDPSMRAFLDMEREMAMRIQHEEDTHDDERE